MDFIKNVFSNFNIIRQKKVKVIRILKTPLNYTSNSVSMNKVNELTNTITLEATSRANRDEMEQKHDEIEQKHDEIEQKQVEIEQKQDEIEQKQDEVEQKQDEIVTSITNEVDSSDVQANLPDKDSIPAEDSIKDAQTPTDIDRTAEALNSGDSSLKNIDLGEEFGETNECKVGVRIENDNMAVDEKIIASDGNNNSKLGDDDGEKTYIDLDEFESILKTQQINTSLNLDDIDEYIANVEDKVDTELNMFDVTRLSLMDTDNDDLVKREELNSEIISISSDDDDFVDNLVLNNDIIYISDSDSYHSSDFEFISEEEAKLDGFIINFKAPKKRNLRKESLVNRKEFSNDSIKLDPLNIPLTENGSQKENINEMQIHHVPEGDNFLALFQGAFNPVLPHSEIFFMENKSVRVTSMHTGFDGIGFDRPSVRRRNFTAPNDEFEDEAKENAKRILEMYPIENKRRRRRCRFSP